MHISSEKLSDRHLEINSCALQEVTDRNRSMLRRDGRVDYHILYIIKGVCYLTEEGEQIAVPAGHMILYLPGERQEYAFLAADKTLSGYIHFSGTGCAALLAALGLEGKRVYKVGESSHLTQVFKEMVEEWVLKKPFWQENSAALLQRFLTAAARRCHYDAAGINLRLRHSMEAICLQMHKDYRQNRDLSYYAGLCHLSVGRFAHLFKESTGRSPGRYLQEIRVNAALELLAGTDLSVSEVAQAVGVEDVNYFCRMIKKHTGRTPKTQR